MAHTLGGVSIHVDDAGYVRTKTSNYSRQHPLDATEDTLGYFGANSAEFDLVFVLFESENSNTGLSSLEGFVNADANRELVMDDGSQGNVRILSLQSTRRQALNHSSLVWDCVARLVKV